MKGLISNHNGCLIYRETAQKLLDEDHAYLCYCSPERLEAMRQEQMKRKQPPKYDRRCRHLTQQEKTQLEATGITPVIRFKTPLEGETTFHDLIYDRVTFKHDTLDDFVLLKSDGYPTYHLANIVDDHLMSDLPCPQGRRMALQHSSPCSALPELLTGRPLNLLICP